MGPAQTHAVDIITGASIQDEGPDSERHWPDCTNSLHSPHMRVERDSVSTSKKSLPAYTQLHTTTLAKHCHKTKKEKVTDMLLDMSPHTGDRRSSSAPTTPSSTAMLSNQQAECSLSASNQPVLTTDDPHSQPHKPKPLVAAASGVQSASNVQSETHKRPVVAEGCLQTSADRNQWRDSNPALSMLDAASRNRLKEGRTAASCATPTISGSVTNLAQSDGDIDRSNVIMDGGRVCWCQLGHACQLCHLKTATPAEHRELISRELVNCETRWGAGADKTGLEVAGSDTDGKLAQCDPQLGNMEARVGTPVMESRKRKLGQSGMFLLDLAIRLGVPKQARVEDNCNFNHNSAIDIPVNESQVQQKLSENRLKQVGGSHRHMDDNMWAPEPDQRGENWRSLGDERRARRSLAAGLDARVQQVQPHTQPDLWDQMEGLCQTTQGKPGSRRRMFTDTIIKRSVADRNFEPGLAAKMQAVWIPGVRPVTKHVLACDGCQPGNIRTGSRMTRRTSSKTSTRRPATSFQKTFSTRQPMAGRCPSTRRYRLRSNSSSSGSSRSRSRSHSASDYCRDQSCDGDNCDEYVPGMSSKHAGHYRCHCQHQPRSWLKCRRCRASYSQSGLSVSRLSSRPRYKQARCQKPHGLDLIKQLFAPLVLPASVTTVIAAPVTGTSSSGKGNGGSGAVNIPSVGNSMDNKHPSATTLSSPEKAKKVNGGQNVFLANAGDKNKFEGRGNEASFETNSMSVPSRAQNMANSRMGGAKMDSGSQEHYMGPVARSGNHFGEQPDHNMQREQQRYEQHFNNVGYHPSLDHSFSEDAGYEFYGADYDYLYDEGNDEYGFGNEPYPPHLHQRHPGPNTYYPRRAPPQGPRGPPQMFASNERSYGPPRLGMAGPSSRMGPNGPVGSRGPRSPMGPRGHRPQGGPGGPLGPPVMRGPPRGSPYGPPRGSPYGPPGPMRPQGMRGPPGPGMMGQAGHGGPAGPRPRIGPPARMQSPMPRHSSQPPSGLRPRMGPPPSGPAPRDDQYLPQRPAVLPANPGEQNFCSPLPNLSQPPPNFVPSTSSLPASTTTPAAASATQIVDVVEPPPPLPPPKPPTPKPPPPPKKEEEKKEEIKPMTPLIPPEQAEQYRKLREQARKHARKQQRKQEHQAKGEPESSDDDDEEAAKRKEYEVKLAAEREEMEKAALLAVEDNGALHYEEGAAILMPATQQTMIQQPTMMVQHHPLATQPTSYGYMPASQFLHTAHPGLHPSQLQNLQFMTSPGQPQLVQLPNGQMAYATAAPMAYQTAGPMVAMQHTGTMSAGGMPHHVLFSSGGMHQLPVSSHPGLTLSGSQYMAHVMASQVQAAQIQAAQAAQIQAAQAAQVQAAQAAQIQAAQAAQVQAAQAAQVQAAQVAQAQAAQAQVQVQSGMPGMVPGMHMAQHVLPGIHPQGQYILVPRVARPQM